jgi:type I restriction enzyme S subunit
MQNSVSTQERWQNTTLGALADYINGYAFKPRDWQPSGLPIVRIAQMTDPSEGFDYYPHSLPEKYRIDTGDLLFSWSATLAAVIWQRGPAYLNQHIYKVVPRDGTDKWFLHHLLNHLIEKLAGYTHGTTMRHIKRSDLIPFPVSIPEKPEQSNIGKVLDAADEAIAKAEAVNVKLRQVRAGMLHDLLTRGLDENGQIRDPIAQPKQFQNSPLGQIPRAWEVWPLGHALTKPPRNGYSPQEAHSFNGSYLLGLGCLTPEGFAPVQLKNAPVGDINLEGFQLKDGDLLISRSNTRELVGLSGIFFDFGHPCYYPDLMMRLQLKDGLSPRFLELVLRYSRARSLLVAGACGTSGSMVKITGARVMETPIPVPDFKEQQLILSKLDPLQIVIRTLTSECSKLKCVKSGLMSDLLTGRVRVPEGIT